MRAGPVLALLIVLAAGAASSPLAAQRQELTVVGGGNFSSASGGGIDKSTALSGFQAGLSIRLPRSPMVSFQTELLVVQRRFNAERAPSSLPSYTVGPRSDAPNLLFLQVPLTLRIQKGYSTARLFRPYLVVGPYFAIRLACRRELVEASGGVTHPDCGITGHGATVDPFFPALYQDIDVGFVGELGVEVRRLSLGVRGEKSIRPLVEAGAIPTSPLAQSKIWSISVSAGYLLRVL